MTDGGISALEAGCGQLQSISLEGCNMVTDVGKLMLGVGCRQLQSVNFEGCDKVTHEGMSSMSHAKRFIELNDLDI
jgi:hypothetical protein